MGLTNFFYRRHSSSSSHELLFNFCAAKSKISTRIFSKDDLYNHSVVLGTGMLSKGSEDDNQVWFRHITGLNVKSEHVPFIIGTIASTTLILFLIFIYILWRFCLSSEKKKTRDAVHIETIGKNLSNNTSYSTLFLDSKSNQFLSSSRIVELIPEHDGSLRWFYKNHTFLQMSHDNENKQHSPVHWKDANKQNEVNKENTPRNSRSRSRSIILSPIMNLENYSLPPISEFYVHPCVYTSSSILDAGYSQENDMNFRTRSLPSCVRHKKQSLSNADSAAELYDKVNFSKKRKNRMRNDEAAIIALSKSQSQFFNKDTDILVDNEAVIVYDERTAL